MTVEHQDTSGGVVTCFYTFTTVAPQAVFKFAGQDMQTLLTTGTFSQIFASTMSYMRSGVSRINKEAVVIDTVLSRASVLPHPAEVFLVPCKRCGWGGWGAGNGCS